MNEESSTYVPPSSPLAGDGPSASAAALPEFDDGAALLRNIASLTSISLVQPENDYTPAENDSWAMGIENELELLSSVNTPITPALIAVSPGATPHVETMERVVGESDSVDYNGADGPFEESEYDYMEDLLHERKRRWAQERLAAAVFCHPQSLRSYCVEAYSAATEIKKQKDEAEADPEVERPCARNQQLAHPRSRRRRKELIIVHDLVDACCQNVPISVLLDLSCGVVQLYCASLQCTFKISANSSKIIVSALSHVVVQTFDGISNFNPFAVLDAIISLQVNAMGKTSEVLASGIQSVATGVGSASSLALHRLSRGGVGNLSANRTGSSSSSLVPNGLLSNGRSSLNNQLQKKLLRRVSTINSAAEVISYMELEDDTGGLSRHAKSRVQRMMHYDVSLRPFVATVAMPRTLAKSKVEPFDNIEFAGENDQSQSRDPREGGDSSDSSSPMNDSPFMCTPQSFPPTPASRRTVLARSTRFADDVVFLARDQLRVHDALESNDERTREMARALSEGKRLAVFDAKDAGRYAQEIGCNVAFLTV